MDSFNTIENKVKLLGALRALTFNRLSDSYWSKGVSNLHELKQSFEGFKLICESLGITPDIKLVFGDESNLQRLISGFANVLFLRDKLHEEIREAYGKKVSFLFSVTHVLLLIRMTASILMQLKLISVPKKRLSFVCEEREKGFVVIEEMETFLTDPSNYEGVIELWGLRFGRQIQGLCKIIKNKERTALWAKKVYDATEKIVNDLVPEYGEIEERTQRAEELIKDLSKCSTGMKYWRMYEDVCAKILRFLFIPPFAQIKLQVRSSGNYERRDAILPNNQYSGFWHLIRSEFNSRHIICEFKNSRSGGSKDWLNQLRIYLSKPTIGKFGMLFIRNTPSRSLIQAQRDAYEQDRILILLINDVKLKELIKYKCYLNQPEVYLENEKIKFEIEY